MPQLSIANIVDNGDNTYSVNFSGGDVVNDGWNPNNLRAKDPNGNWLMGIGEPEVDESTLLVEMDDAPDAGLVPLDGTATLINLTGLRDAFGTTTPRGAVARATVPQILSVARTDTPNVYKVTFDRNTRANLLDSFRVSNPDNTHRKGDTVTAGDDTAVWTLATVADVAESPPPANHWNAAGGVGADNVLSTNSAAHTTALLLPPH